MNATTIPILANLKFTADGRKRLDDVLAFLDELDARGVPQATRARTELVERLLYLDGYGGTVSETDQRRRFEVTVGRDMYPLSFTITWKAFDKATGGYAYCMNGGLVWHGGPFDPGAVSLDSNVLWGIHT